MRRRRASRRRIRPPTRARRLALHAAEPGQTRVVFVDGAPVLPRLAEAVRLGLVLEQVCHLPRHGAQRVGGNIGKERKERVDELRGGEGAALIRRDVLSEEAQLGCVVAEEVCGALNDGAVPDQACAVLGRHVGCIGEGEHVHCIGELGAGDGGANGGRAGGAAVAGRATTGRGGAGRGRGGGELAAKGALRNRLRRVNGHLSLKRNLVSTKRLRVWRRHRVLVRVPTPSTTSSPRATFTVSAAAATTTTAPLLLVRRPEVKTSHVHHPRITADRLAAGVLSQVVRLQIHVGLEHDKLLLHALPVIAEKVILFEMLLQRIVVYKVVWLAGVAAVTEEAAFVLHAAMLVQAIVVVEAFAAEAAQWVALEARLIGRAGLVVAASHVLLELAVGEELVLVRKDLFVARAQVAHALAVRCLDVAVEVGPAEAGEIARGVGAVVPEEEDRVADNVLVGVFDANVGVDGGEIGGLVVFKPFFGIVCKDDVRSLGSAMCTVLGLVECSHAQSADVAGFVVAGGNGVVRHRVGADEAHLFVVVAVLIVVDVLRRPVSRGRDASLLLGRSSSDGDVLRGGLGGQVILFGAAPVASTASSSTAASTAVLAATIAAASAAISSSARGLAVAAASR